MASSKCICLFFLFVFPVVAIAIETKGTGALNSCAGGVVTSLVMRSLKQKMFFVVCGPVLTLKVSIST